MLRREREWGGTDTTGAASDPKGSDMRARDCSMEKAMYATIRVKQKVSSQKEGRGVCRWGTTTDGCWKI